MLINKELAKEDIIIPRDTSWIMIKHLISLGLKVVVAAEDSYRVCTLTYDSVRNDVGLSSNIQPLTVSNIKTLIELLKFYAQGQRLGRFTIRYLMLNEIGIHLTVSRDTL